MTEAISDYTLAALALDAYERGYDAGLPGSTGGIGYLDAGLITFAGSPVGSGTLLATSARLSPALVDHK